MRKQLTYGMVGGGKGSFIGEAHRTAIRLDGKAALAAGCFSRSYDNTLETGAELGIEQERLYQSYEEMAIKESAREDKIDFVVVVTPNGSHYEVCKVFLEQGFHVSCDKPLTVTVEQALELEALAVQKRLLFMVTYVYSGHVTSMNIRAMIAAGEIGEIRTIMAEYPQGWLAFPDVTGNKQAEWRVNPELSGKSNALGDIGTHIENTVYRMTGLRIKRLLARMEKVVPGRKLDDNSTVLVEYDNGASGTYWASQIAIGQDNSLRVRIYGSKGTILWFQEQPEKIEVIREDGSRTELRRGCAQIKPVAAKYQRLPGGHVEGWFEAMANIYANFITCVEAWKGGTYTEDMAEYPTVSDGVNGVRFIDACVEKAEKGNVWIEVDE